MKKKLLAGILALALCSTNMPPQTIFAGEFTSGNPDVVSEEETPEIFTNEEQETAGETDGELSVFSSEEVPENLTIPPMRQWLLRKMHKME